MAKTQFTQPLHLRRPRIHEEIADYLQARMAGQNLSPGTRLPSGNDLAAELEVSRATVSEAMRVLEARGLIERKLGSGTFVADRVQRVFINSMGRLAASAGCSSEDLATFREMLEPAVAALAAERASENDVAELREILERMDQAARSLDADAFVSADTEFHAALAAATGNALIAAVSLGLRELVHPVLSAIEERSVPYSDSVGRHQRILDSVAAHDAAAAERAMRTSISGFRQSMDRATENDRRGD